MRDIKDVVDEIKQRSDIGEIISDYIRLKPSGSGFTGLCPFHNEKTPSFHVNTDRQTFKCFGCGEGGDAIAFIMKIENVDFNEAVSILGDRYGIDTRARMSGRDKETIEKENGFIEINTQAARYFYYCLNKTENNAMEYLKKRGLNEDIIFKFGLGYAPDSWDSLCGYLRFKGYSDKDILDAGLALRSKKSDRIYDRFRNRIMFPIFDYRGRIIAFGGRVLDNALPKYLNSPESIFFNKRNNLYGLNFSKKEIKNRTLILVEGYMDLISLSQYGINNTIATLGTALTLNQAALIKRFADRVKISYDSDSAGKKAALRSLDILKEKGIEPEVVIINDGKDPDEYIRANGAKAYMRLVDEAEHRLRFKIDMMREDYDLNLQTDKIKFVGRVCDLLKKEATPIESGIYTKYLSEITGVSLKSIEVQVSTATLTAKGNASGRSSSGFGNRANERNPYAKGGFPSNGPKGAGTSEFGKGAHSGRNPFIDYTSMKERRNKPKVDKKLLYENELRALNIMIHSADRRGEFLTLLSPEDFIDEQSNKLFTYILNNKQMGISLIGEPISDELSTEYKGVLKELEYESYDSIGDDLINKLVKSIKRSSLENKISVYSTRVKNLEQELKENENLENKDGIKREIMELTIKVIEINKQLKNI